MFTGKRFRLKVSCVGVEMDGVGRAILIPADEIVVVLKGPRSDDAKMLEVVWNEKTLAMYVRNLTTNGEEIDQP
jgi:hypothetical protein